jgi:hypothetical protein
MDKEFQFEKIKTFLELDSKDGQKQYECPIIKIVKMAKFIT